MLRKIVLIYTVLHKVYGNEPDQETGLYYYGARYLDPKTSRWISSAPALGEYIPQSPVSDEARKHNKSLPGMGGVYNLVNLQLYHYAGNNPFRYVDPDGREMRIVGSASFQVKTLADMQKLTRDTLDMRSDGTIIIKKVSDAVGYLDELGNPRLAIGTYTYIGSSGMLITDTGTPREELRTVGLGYVFDGDVTENQIRHENELCERAAY